MKKGDDTSFVFFSLLPFSDKKKKTTKERRISPLFYLFYGPFGEPSADILFRGPILELLAVAALN